jgi:hypothetical protein
MDDKLTKQQVKPGEVHLVVPMTTGLLIGKVWLPYRDVASVVRKMYRDIEIVRRVPNA